MDTLAHGLWGGAVFGQEKRGSWKWAFWLGMAPDLFSFGPYFLIRLPDIIHRWTNQQFEPPDPRTIPAYVYHAYDVTHSLVVWAGLFGLIWYWRRMIFWPLAAWMLHILCDIPTHSTRFFPTPFLWPFPTPFVNGTPWSRAPFMVTNYTLIGVAYLLAFCYKKYSQPPSK